MTPPRRPTFAVFWRKFIALPPHREQRRFIAAVDSGRFPELFLHWSKKTAKSFSAAAALTHHLIFGDEPEDRRIAIASYGEDQSVEIVFRQHKQLVERDPRLSRLVKCYRAESVYVERVRNERTGGSIKREHVVRALARNLKVVHGEDWSFIVRDEYWTEPDHEFDEALIVSPTRRAGAILYLSYHAPRTMMRPSVPFFDLLRRAEAGDDALFYSYIGGDGADAAWNVAPWVKPAWVEQQRKVFAASPARFRRIILNLPGGSDSGLITPEEIQAALYTPVESRRGFTYFCAVDLGAVHDFTAVTVGHMEGRRLHVDLVRVWRGTKATPVSFIAVTQTLIDLHRVYGFERVHLDTWQARMVMESLQAAGISARIVDFTSMKIDKLVTQLKSAFLQRQIKIPRTATTLIEQLESVTAIESRRRDLLRFEPAESRGHDDCVVSLALLIDAVKSSLGSWRLPEFSCLKAAAQDSFDRSSCALFGGTYHCDDPICRSCDGWIAARGLWREHLDGGGEPKDFWRFCREDLKLSERDAWAEARAYAKSISHILT